MRTFLLTWNPNAWPWDRIGETVASVRAGDPQPARWSTGPRKDIDVGDRLFLLRQGAEPRGIIGAGRATSTVFQAPHWDGEPGHEANYVEFVFDALLDPRRDPVLPTPVLSQTPSLEAVNWATQSSGIQVHETAVDALENLWKSHLASAQSRAEQRPSDGPRGRPQAEISDLTSDPAVMEQRVARLVRTAVARPYGQEAPERVETTTHSYLRDPAVAAWVLQQARGHCEFCMRPAPFARADGSPFLEVHHVKHLAERGPDTIENAVALCPSCHRAMHHAADAHSRKAQLFANVKRLHRLP